MLLDLVLTVQPTWVEILAILGAHVDEEDLGLLKELAGQQLLQRQVRA